MWTFKSNIALASYCRSYLIFQRNIRISNLLPILVCDMCYHARKINSFPCKGQFNKSRIFRISQGKFNSFKDVRGSWHAYSCIFTEVKHVPLAEAHFYVEISNKFTPPWVFVSHARTQVTINTFVNYLVLFTEMTRY